jgi:Flp pilus assembly protein TadG
MKNFCLRLSHQLARLRRDQAGVSAVEFAMLLPLMLTLYLGAVEISQGVAIDRKVTLTSRTVADLASQVATLDSPGMSNVINASSQVIMPYDSSRLKVTLSEVTIDANSNATITWSCSFQGTPRSIGSTVTLPAALAVANTSLVWGEASYNYKPVIGYVVTGTLNLKDQIYMRPRTSNSVNFNGACP